MDEDAAFWKHSSDLTNKRLEEMIVDRDRWRRDALDRSSIIAALGRDATANDAERLRLAKDLDSLRRGAVERWRDLTLYGLSMEALEDLIRWAETHGWTAPK